MAQHLSSRWRVARDHRLAHGQSHENLDGHHPSGLGAIAEGTHAYISRNDMLGNQFLRREPPTVEGNVFHLEPLGQR